MERLLTGDVHGAAEKCGARKRADDVKGEPCRNPAGFKTAHVGVGRCYLHGGATPITHGRYSTIKRENIRDLITKHEADPDPLNILPELAAARALLEDFVDRYDEFSAALLTWHESYGEEKENPKPRQILDIADAHRLVSEVTKIVERIEGIRSKNAISRPDLARFMAEMWRSVELRIADIKTREQLRDDWLSIRL